MLFESAQGYEINGMAKKQRLKRNKEEIKKDLADIFKWRTGKDKKTWREIAEELSKRHGVPVNHSAIYKQFREAQEAILEDELKEYRRRIFVDLEFIKSEALDAWDKSKQVTIKTTVKTKPKAKSGNPEEDQSNDQRAPGTQESIIETTVVRETRSGNPAFIANYLKAVNQQQQLLGVNAPIKIEKSDGEIGDTGDEEVVRVYTPEIAPLNTLGPGEPGPVDG